MRSEKNDKFLNRLHDIYTKLNKKIVSADIINDKNFCRSCTRCCHFLYRFPVSSLEISYIYNIYRGIEHPENFTDFLNGRLKNPDNSKVSCPYSTGVSCSIYDARPMCCRLYGLSPYRPLLENCVFLTIREKAHALWQSLIPLFREFIDMKFDYYRRNMEDFKPVTISDFLDRGSIFAMNKDFYRAKNDFEEALRINPNDPISHSYSGWLYELQGDKEKALYKYKLCLKLDPLDYITHLKIGFLLQELQRIEEAFAHYKKVLEIDPYNAQAWGNIGLIYLSTGQWKDSEMAYLKAIELDPGNSTYHVCLGNVWYSLNKVRKTISQMKKSLKLNPQEDIAYLCLGSIYEKRGNLKKSIDNYRKFIKYSNDEMKKRVIHDRITYLESLSTLSSHTF